MSGYADGWAMALSRAESAHLLRRVGFGGSDAEVDALVGRSRSQAVDTVMDLAGQPPATYPPPSGEGDWKDWANTSRWWVDRMTTSSHPLAEKLTLFWHGHFACGFEKIGQIRAMWDQQTIFRTHGLGSFPTLLEEVSVSSAMLVYIDNETNVAGAVQENFARELMELHTIGVGNFTEADVVAMARAWTGHNVVGWTGSTYDLTYRFRPERHDSGPKTLFGITADWDGTGRHGGRSTLDELCWGTKQAATARFVAAKLFRFFAHTSPSAAVVQGLADRFVASGLDLAALVREILLHDEFWAPTTRYALVKTPVEFTVDALRRTSASAPDWIPWLLASMGQELFNPPNVAGWGQNGYWLSTASSWARGELAWNLAWRARDLGFLDGLASATPAVGVQRIFDALGIVEPSPATRNRLESWFATARSSYSWAIQPHAVVLGILSPDFQLA